MRALVRGACLLATLVVAGCGGSDSDGKWLAAWGATHESTNSFALAPRETTVRIGAAALGIRPPGGGAALIPNSNRPVTFNGGQTSATLPPDTPSYYSDPIGIEVAHQDDLAISLYIVGDDNPAQFGTAWNHSYKLPNQSGDDTLDESGAGFGLIDDTPAPFPAGTPLRCSGCRPYVLRDVEVLTTQARGAMVFLGSSSFHGANTSQDAFKRVSDLIALRIQNEIPVGDRQTVVNRAISGDTLEAAYRGRMDTDVWSTQGLRSVVVWVTNDLERRSADEIIATYRALIADADARGVKVYCPTRLPGRQNLQASLDGERRRLNDWIVDSGECDGVADYNAAVEAPGARTFLPQYNSGDFTHANDAGHAAWTGITPISDWLLGR